MYKNILVAIDDSETSGCALADAVHIARSNKARLYITHVADETLMEIHGRTLSTMLNIDDALAAITTAGRQLLDESARCIEGVSVETILLEARNRHISEVIVDKAKELQVDLIVIGRHGRRGLATLILGSVAEQVAKIAHTSVLLVRKH